jgi:hypothetical protein
VTTDLGAANPADDYAVPDLDLAQQAIEVTTDSEAQGPALEATAATDCSPRQRRPAKGQSQGCRVPRAARPRVFASRVPRAALTSIAEAIGLKRN